ncbi:hypothetical protein [Shewanella sp. UCD-KL12]|uniref:hypothetical protein n=1 Tax=Shewanella sp. UCD-KL12 TaxID=1917163 RepID=UPI0009710CA3|nr:hypothetical protein [Shewanella sp. UCD-KL12]
MDSQSDRVRKKIAAFFDHQHADKRFQLFSILSEELDLLFEQAEMLDASERHGLSSLSHQLKGICSYLSLHNEPVFQKTANKQELLLNISMLKNEVKVIQGEI